MKTLQNKVAFITGADSGIGRATAIAYAAEGAKVAITYRSDEEGALATQKSLEPYGVASMVLHLDVTEEKQVTEVLERVVSELGGLDILVNNAAVNGSGIPVGEMNTETFDTTLKTNIYGVFFTCRWFVQYLKKNNRKGKIINISSIHEAVVAPGNADYNASKGALKGFTQTLALELAASGTTVNNIAPGMILTPMNQKAIDDKEQLEKATQHIPLKRAGQPEEIAQLAVFLASAAADYVTGSTYTMDGGLMLQLGQGA